MTVKINTGSTVPLTVTICFKGHFSSNKFSIISWLPGSLRELHIFKKQLTLLQERYLYFCIRNVSLSLWEKSSHQLLKSHKYSSHDGTVSIGLVEGSWVQGSGSCNADVWWLVHSSIMWIWVMLCTYNGSMHCMLP